MVTHMSNKKKSNNSHQLVSITKFVSDRPLSKKYWLEENKIEKSPLANMSSGTAERIEIPFDDLPELIESADEYTAFGWGVFDKPKVNIVCTRYEDLANLNYGRNLNNMHYIEGEPAVMMIDYDHSDDAPKKYTPYELRNALYSVIPELKKCAYFVRGSISSGISIKGTKSKLKGFHIYVLVADGSKIPEFAKQLVKALWCAGHGHIKVSAAGVSLERLCIDPAVFSPERLDLQGKPIYDKSGLQYVNPRCFYHDGVAFDCKPPEVNEEQYNTLVKEAKESKKEECRIKREIWLAKQSIKYTDKGYSKEEATKIVNEFLDSEHKVLDPKFELDFGTEVVTVEDVLKNVKKYHNKALYDPIEGREYGHKTAIFWANTKNNKPVVHSRARGIDVNYWLKKSWQQELADHVVNTNKKFCKVMYTGKAYIAMDTFNVRGNKKFEFCLACELAKHNSQHQIQVGVNGAKNAPVYKDIITAWATHEKVSARDDVVFEPIRPKYNKNAKIFDAPELFLPNNNNEPIFNIWRGFTVRPFKDRVQLDIIRWHMLHVLCDEDEELYTFLIKWCAYTFQFPDLPATSVIVLKGEKRIGKGLFGSFLLPFWGAHGLHISSKEYLTGKYTGHLAETCYLFADEAFYAGDKESEGRLKALVTERELITEKKFLNMSESQNCLKILMATNNDWCVPATHDEDRYCVFNVSNKMKGDRAYMTKVAKNLKEELVKRAFLEWMLSIDLTGFNPQDIPRNEALGEQIQATFGAIQLWFQDRLVIGKIFASDDHWSEVVTVENLHASYLLWCDSHKRDKYDFAISNKSIGRYFAKIEGFRPAFNNKGIRGRGYVLGSLEHTIKCFESHEHIKLF